MEVTCINCPLGCMLTVDVNNGFIENISGYKCLNGRKYAESECTNPVRTVTTTIEVIGGERKVVPVRTAGKIPRNMIFKLMEDIKKISIEAPVKAGITIISDYADTGVNVITTKAVDKAR